jgi:antitoxin CptB
MPHGGPKWYTPAHIYLSEYPEVFVSTDRSLMTKEDLAIEKKRLAWHSRRGMKELDVLLGPFLSEVYDDLSEDDQRKYRDLLDNQDPDLFTLFMRTSQSSNPELQYMVDMILDRVQPS